MQISIFLVENSAKIQKKLLKTHKIQKNEQKLTKTQKKFKQNFQKSQKNSQNFQKYKKYYNFQLLIQIFHFFTTNNETELLENHFFNLGES